MSDCQRNLILWLERGSIYRLHSDYIVIIRSIQKARLLGLKFFILSLWIDSTLGAEEGACGVGESIRGRIVREERMREE